MITKIATWVNLGGLGEKNLGPDQSGIGGWVKGKKLADR